MGRQGVGCPSDSYPSTYFFVFCFYPASTCKHDSNLVVAKYKDTWIEGSNGRGEVVAGEGECGGAQEATSIVCGVRDICSGVCEGDIEGGVRARCWG